MSRRDPRAWDFTKIWTLWTDIGDHPMVKGEKIPESMAYEIAQARRAKALEKVVAAARSYKNSMVASMDAGQELPSEMSGRDRREILFNELDKLDRVLQEQVAG